jgi:hypothetical protein
VTIALKALQVLAPVSKVTGKIHMPFSRKKIQGPHFYSILKYLKPGAVLVSRTEGEITNFLIDGHYKHAAMFASITFRDELGEPFEYPYVIEAIGKGVSITDLISFMTSKDEILLLYPKFCDQSGMESAAKIAHKYLNAPYDYYFTPGNHAFYCSEMIMEAYKEACGSVPFSPRLRLGVPTILAQDYVDALDKWDIVWSSHS